MEFLQALTHYPFLQRALLAGIFASVACGVVGTFVVTRRITLIAGSLAHCVMAGLGAAYYFRVVHGVAWLEPLHGAIVAGILAALIVAATRSFGETREDTIISALWAIGMAVGLLFLSQTPGYKADLFSYLFGNIVLVEPGTLYVLMALDVLVLALTLLFHNQLFAVCFDEEFARLRGVRVELFYALLLVMTAITIITLIYVVGIVLVIALLTLPVAIAGWFSSRLWQMMLLSAVLSAIFTSGGLAVSYAPDLPVGATTVVLSAVVFVLARLLRAPLRRILKQ